MIFRKGDYVEFATIRGWRGRVIRVARDQSWIDVDWGSWSKRQPNPQLNGIEHAAWEKAKGQ